MWNTILKRRKKLCECGECGLVVTPGRRFRSGHNPSSRLGTGKPISPPQICACGQCGLMTKPGNKYVNHHYTVGKASHRKGTGKSLPPAKLCECGYCGLLAKPGNRYILGHSRKGKTDKRQSERMKSKWKDPIFKKNMKESHAETLASFEYREKQSLLQKEAQNRPEVKEKKSISEKIAHNLPGVKEKMIKRNIIIFNRPEMKKMSSIKFKTLWQDKDYIEKQKKASKTKYKNSITKMSKNTQQLWQDPEFVKKQMKARNVSQNKKEKYLEGILNKLYPKEYKFVGDGEVIIGGKCPDFININGQKKIIELFGDYWHRNDNSQDRINLFKPYGYETLVIWEKELKDMDMLKFRIHKFHRS